MAPKLAGEGYETGTLDDYEPSWSWGDYWARDLPRLPLSNAAVQTGLTPGTNAYRLYQAYDTGRMEVPELPETFHLHYMIHKGRPRWVVAMRPSYVCNGPRCKVVINWRTRP